MQFGTLMHAWFEVIDWLDDDPDLSDRRLIQVAAKAEVTLLDAASLVDKFRNYLETPLLQSLLRRDTYQQFAQERSLVFPRSIQEDDDLPLFPSTGKPTLEVRNEVTVATAVNEITWGVIDRLVLWLDEGQVIAAHILDYKTDTGETEDLAETYREQLNTYRTAVAGIYGLGEQQVQADLILLASGVIA